MKILTQFHAALHSGLSKAVFDHIRNYLMCAFIFAIGMNEFKQHTNLFFDLVPRNYTGTGVIGLSCILITLNLYDGIWKISKFKHHFLLTIVLIMLYLFISMRVIGMAWNYRSI